MQAGNNYSLIARRQMIGELMAYFYVSKYMISDGLLLGLINKGG